MIGAFSSTFLFIDNARPHTLSFRLFIDRVDIRDVGVGRERPVFRPQKRVLHLEPWNGVHVQIVGNNGDSAKSKQGAGPEGP